MNFQSLEYFIALARERNFTRASEALHITQQSLSSHIAGLEKELNCQLVVRRTPLELTYAGKTFLHYADDIRKTLHAMQQEFCDIAENQKGELRVGIAYTRGRAIMPSLIAAFQSEYPNVEINLTEDSNEALQKLLLDGDIDLAIANFPKALPEVELVDFYMEDVVLLLSNALLKKHSIDLSEQAHNLEAGDLSSLQNCPFVLGSTEDIAGRIGRDLILRSGFEPVVKAKSNNVETLLTLCGQGVGACFSPENLVYTALPKQQIEKLHILRFSSGSSYPIRFGYLKRSYQWSMISEFIRIAREQYSMQSHQEHHSKLFKFN